MLAFCSIAELGSLRYKSSAKARILIAVELAMIMLATVTIWVAERGYDDWLLIILSIAVPVVAQNISAYYIGRFIMPSVKNNKDPFAEFLRWHNFKSSPKKTLGVIIISSTLAVAVTLPWTLHSPLLITTALISSIATPFGDLLESKMKRLVGVKDSGERLRTGSNLLAVIERSIASHGGFLDRFDSLTFTLALALIPIIVFLI